MGWALLIICTGCWRQQGGLGAGGEHGEGRCQRGQVPRLPQEHLWLGGHTQQPLAHGGAAQEVKRGC